MVTGAALATVNRIPVLLLPGDVFATRVANPVLQEIEDPTSMDISVNDAFKPVSRFWDRINRPEQLASSLLAAMRVLTDPARPARSRSACRRTCRPKRTTGPTSCSPSASGMSAVPRSRSPRSRAPSRLIRGSQRPVIVAGGGVIYSQATEALREFAEATGVPVVESQAGKGSLAYDHPQSLGRSRGDRYDGCQTRSPTRPTS